MYILEIWGNKNKKKWIPLKPFLYTDSFTLIRNSADIDNNIYSCGNTP